MPTDHPAKFEDALARLEEIVHELEEGELGLEESLVRYEEGVKHLGSCYQALEKAERRIELLTGVDEDGNPLTRPFAEQNATTDEQVGRRGKRPKPAKEPRTPVVEPEIDDQGPTLF